MDMSYETVRESLETIDPLLASTPVDMIFTGPFDGNDEYSTLAKLMQRPFSDPLGVGFREIGERPPSVFLQTKKKIFKNSREGRLFLYKEIFDLLHDDSLAEATYHVCKVISERYDFETRLEPMLNRSIWHHIQPELKAIELDVIGEMQMIDSLF